MQQNNIIEGIDYNYYKFQLMLRRCNIKKDNIIAIEIAHNKIAITMKYDIVVLNHLIAQVTNAKSNRPKMWTFVQSTSILYFSRCLYRKGTYLAFIIH